MIIITLNAHIFFLSHLSEVPQQRSSPRLIQMSESIDELRATRFTIACCITKSPILLQRHAKASHSLTHPAA